MKNIKNYLFLFIEGICVAYGFSALASVMGATFDWLIMWAVCLLFMYVRRRETDLKDIRSWMVNLIAVLFTVVIVIGLGYERFEEIFYYKIRVVFATAGLFFFFRFVIALIYRALDSLGANVVRPQVDVDSKNARKLFFFSFCFFWIVSLIYLLDIYPGSMCVDSEIQLQQVLGIIPYDNANPLMNTWAIELFVKFAEVIGGDVNLGIALYCVFQYTVFALVYAYGLRLLYELGYSRWVIVAAFVMWGFIPHSIVYASQMWKDSFFSVQFLLLYLLAWRAIAGKSSPVRYVFIVLISGLACMSRLTAWPIIMILSILFVISSFVIKGDMARNLRWAGLSIFIGIFAGLMLVRSLDVFDSKASTWAYALPEQQISAVLASGVSINDEDMQLLEAGADIDKVRQDFVPDCADYTSIYTDRDYVRGNFGAYTDLYLRWWKKYPWIFIREFADMTKGYCNPLVPTWAWDTRVLDNSVGVSRSSVLHSHFDEALSYASQFPVFRPFHRAGVYLWLVVLACGYLIIRKKFFNLILYLPLLAHYAEYMLTSPVALFRYMYPVVILTPLLVVWALRPVCEGGEIKA